MENEELTSQEAADRAKVSSTLVSQRITLAYVAPAVLEAILEGQQSRTLRLEDVEASLPLD